MPNTNLFYRKKVLNLAHRGASQYAPENTLAAFRLAAEMGADGVELDVKLSKDGEVVIIHNDDVSATTNGQGLVKEKTLAELKALDAGSYFDPKFSQATVPTLQELFIALGPVLLFNIELKTMSMRDEGLEAEVIRLVEDYNLQDQVVLSSFNPFSLKRAYQLNPNIKRALLWYPTLAITLRWKLFRSTAKPDMFHPQWQATTPAIVKREHERGLLVNVWTCNDPKIMHDLIKMGVDSIMTDCPDLLKQVIDEFESS